MEVSEYFENGLHCWAYMTQAGVFALNTKLGTAQSTIQCYKYITGRFFELKFTEFIFQSLQIEFRRILFLLVWLRSHPIEYRYSVCKRTSWSVWAEILGADLSLPRFKTQNGVYLKMVSGIRLNVFVSNVCNQQNIEHLEILYDHLLSHTPWLNIGE